MSRGHKPINKGVRLLKSWSWANKNYSFEVCIKKEAIAKVLIDPSGKSADVNRNNNSI